MLLVVVMVVVIVVAVVVVTVIGISIFCRLMKIFIHHSVETK